MNWAEAVVLIVIVSAGAKVLRTWLMARGGGERHILFDRKGNPTEMRKLMEAPRPEEEALRREVEDLRERIKVLERIATDGRASRDLADEIEKLR